MNADKEQLTRLLRAAARVPQASMPPAPFGFATRTLADWRHEGRVGDFALATVCRRVVLCALATAVAAGVFAYPALAARPDSAHYIEQLSAMASRLAIYGQ